MCRSHQILEVLVGLVVVDPLTPVVHVYLNMFGLLHGNSICGDLNSIFIVTKEDSVQSTTKIKL